MKFNSMLFARRPLSRLFAETAVQLAVWRKLPPVFLSSGAATCAKPPGRCVAVFMGVLSISFHFRLSIDYRVAYENLISSTWFPQYPQEQSSVYLLL